MEEGDKEMLEFIVTAILADYDLYKLIEKRERPFDEYAPEARTIIRYLETENYNVKVDVLAQNIQYIFLCWFEKIPDIVPCIQIAHEIKKLI